MYYQYYTLSASQNECVHREVGCRRYRLLMWVLLCSRTLVYFVMLICLASIDPRPSSDAPWVRRISLCVYVCLCVYILCGGEMNSDKSKTQITKKKKDSEHEHGKTTK